MNFSRGRKSGRESRLIISYAGILSFFIFGNEVCIEREMWFLHVYICIYTRVWLDPRFYTRFRRSSQAFLASSIVYLWLFQRLYCINDVEVFCW